MSIYRRPRKKVEDAFPSVDVERLEEKLMERVVEVPGIPRIKKREREIPYGAFPSVNLRKLEEGLKEGIVEIPDLCDDEQYKPTYRINLLKKDNQ